MKSIENIHNYDRYSKEIESVYLREDTYYSITLDLISLYLKGQKILYTESKTFCEMVLYCLMLPAIFISSACTVLNVPLKGVSYGPTIVSALNGFNSFILAFISYVKLDAKAEAHKTSAYQFDKLQAMCEFYSGKTQLTPINELGKNVYDFVESIEKKVGEIKDANQFSLPEIIRYRYNHIYSYNIFAMMKNYKTKRSIHIQNLINVTNIIKIREQQKIHSCKKCKDTLCSMCKEVRIFMETSLQSYPIKKKSKESFFSLFKKSQTEVNEEIDIYDFTVPIEKLYSIRDNFIRDIIEYRDMTIELTEKYNEEPEAWLRKKQNEWFPIFNWLKV